MKIFEATSVTAEGSKIVIIRVPQAVVENPFWMGEVMVRGAHDLCCRRVLLLSADTGRIFGNHEDKRAIVGFDPTLARWVQWNMVELGL
jgi:hypothetical protein